MISTDSNGTAIIQKNNPMKFENVIFDRTFGSIVEDENSNKLFVAPVKGLYRFELQVNESKLSSVTHSVNSDVSARIWRLLLGYRRPSVRNFCKTSG